MDAIDLEFRSEKCVLFSHFLIIVVPAKYIYPHLVGIIQFPSSFQFLFCFSVSLQRRMFTPESAIAFLFALLRVLMMLTGVSSF